MNSTVVSVSLISLRIFPFEKMSASIGGKKNSCPVRLFLFFSFSPVPSLTSLLSPLRFDSRGHSCLSRASVLSQPPENRFVFFFFHHPFFSNDNFPGEKQLFLLSPKQNHREGSSKEWEKRMGETNGRTEREKSGESAACSEKQEKSVWGTRKSGRGTAQRTGDVKKGPGHSSNVPILFKA